METTGGAEGVALGVALQDWHSFFGGEARSLGSIWPWVLEMCRDRFVQSILGLEIAGLAEQLEIASGTI